MINPFSKIFRVNKAPNRVMIQCRTVVNKDAVRREDINGVEHIIVSSATLPDDVVMNGGLYPADEIEASFSTLENTLAPVEHPVDADGKFMSAFDPHAIHNFHAGAFNKNVRRENGRVFIDKYINIAEAQKSERGKRLLERIEEIETNENARPIHTSTGVFLEPEFLTQPQANSAGDEYTWIARNMVFDHDAILLDTVAAATPSKGVGIAVNKDGSECAVNIVDLDRPNNDGFDRLKLLSNLDSDISFDDIRRAVHEALSDTGINFEWIEEMYMDRAIYWSKDGSLFEVKFSFEDGTANIEGVPIEVERNVIFTPKINHSEGEAMRELMLKALSEAGISVNADISDADLLAQYNELQANQSAGSGDSDGDSNSDGDIASVVANAVTQATKPLSDKIAGLESQLNANVQAEIDRYAEIVANSDKYPGFDVESAKKLDLEKLKEMAANCQSSFGISPVFNGNSGSAHDAFKAPTELPQFGEAS